MKSMQTMSMDVVVGASLAVPLLGYCRTEDEMLRSPEVREVVHRIFAALALDSR
jgi:hypothetical protein